MEKQAKFETLKGDWCAQAKMRGEMKLERWAGQVKGVFMSLVEDAGCSSQCWGRVMEGFSAEATESDVCLRKASKYRVGEAPSSYCIPLLREVLLPHSAQKETERQRVEST